MKLKICGKNIPPRKKVFTSIMVKTRHDFIELPLFVVTGASPGKVLFLVSGEHGTELTGPESIRQTVEQVNPDELSGAIIAVPVANPLAMRNKSHSYPYDKWAWWNSLNNLNRSWPGKADGNMDEVITYTLFNKIMRKSDVVISLHNTNYAPYLSYKEGSKTSKQLCLDFGRIAMIRSENLDSSTSVGCAHANGLPAILVEQAPLRHVNHTAVKETISGLINIMRSLNCLSGEICKIKNQFIVCRQKNKNIKIEAEEDGILVREKPWGAMLKKGDVIARIYDIYKYREAQLIISPVDGLLWSTGPDPGHMCTFFQHTDAVCRGECVAQIFTYSKHIKNENGDEWSNKLLAGPNAGSSPLLQ